MALTSLDREIIRTIQLGDNQAVTALAVKYRFISKSGKLLRSRERNELEAKLQQLNIPIPSWVDER